MKRQPTDGEKIFANDVTDKGLVSKISKQLMMLNITHYQRNANQNHNEVPSHAGQNGCYQKVYKQ